MLNWHHVFVHVFEVVAEPIRRRLVEVLASGSHYLGDLEDVIRHEFGVSRAAVHHHLKVLCENGAVLQHDDWPRSLYELDSALLEHIASELDHWDYLFDRRIGWRTEQHLLPDEEFGPASTRGWRGRGRDPDDPWRRPSRRASDARRTAWEGPTGEPPATRASIGA